MESQLDKLVRNLKSDEYWTSTTIYIHGSRLMLFSCRKYFILDRPSRKLPSALSTGPPETVYQ